MKEDPFDKMLRRLLAVATFGIVVVLGLLILMGYALFKTF